jgi:hypothetical protein
MSSPIDHGVAVPHRALGRRPPAERTNLQCFERQIPQSLQEVNNYSDRNTRWNCKDFATAWILIAAISGVLLLAVLFVDFSLEPVAFGVMSGMAGEFALMVYLYFWALGSAADPRLLFGLGAVAQLLLIMTIMGPLTYVALAINRAAAGSHLPGNRSRHGKSRSKTIARYRDNCSGTATQFPADRLILRSLASHMARHIGLAHPRTRSQPRHVACEVYPNL